MTTTETTIAPTTFAFTPAGRTEPVNIRTVLIDGAPWFVTMDVGRALGLSPHKASYNHHLTRLTMGERGGYPRSKLGLPPGCHVSIISESGLYKLMMRSDKKDAMAFQHWLAAEVLPSIRKTGGYLLNEDARDTAHADQREAMPLPADFMSAFGKMQAELAAPSDPQDVLALTRGYIENPTGYIKTFLG